MVSEDSHYIWGTDFQGRKGWVPVKLRPLTGDSLAIQPMVAMLNEQYPDIRLSYIKTAGDTAFLKIADSKYLTQQMGTDGGDSYLGMVTYNLTEIKDVNYVSFSFKKGDHAEPGVYSRTDFMH